MTWTLVTPDGTVNVCSPPVGRKVWVAAPALAGTTMPKHDAAAAIRSSARNPFDRPVEIPSTASNVTESGRDV
jgi:hypothetical protein